MGLKETIENDAYCHLCRCPSCDTKLYRRDEEYTFFCSECGQHLHARAYTKEELECASFNRRQDDYED